MKFARLTFLVAGAWGVLVLVPLYFVLDTVGRQAPPPVTHPEFYYGFLGVALAWQIAFFVIGSDPVRYRPMMIPAMIEKFGHVATMTILYLRGRMNTPQLLANLPDLLWGVLFVIAFRKTPAYLAKAASLGLPPERR
jgi:hypothetical protein